MKVRAVLACAFLAFVTGCIGSKVAWVEKGSSAPGEKGGCYNLISGDSGTAARIGGSFKAIEDDLVRKGTGMKVKLPVHVYVEEKDAKDTSGAGSVINNFFSVCTLGIWPYVKSAERAVDVKVMSPTDSASQQLVFGEREWSSFILPIAALPCPGNGDWRSAVDFRSIGHNNRGSQDWFGNSRREHEKIAVADLLTRDFYQSSTKKFSAILKQISEGTQIGAGNGGGLPIFLLDSRDVHFRCNGEGIELIDADGVVDLMGDCLKDSGVCDVRTKKAVVRSVQEQAVFATMSTEGGGVADVESPDYRVEVSVERYRFKKGQKQSVIKRKHTFKKDSVIHATATKVVADVQMVINVIDFKNGKTIFSENMTGECKDVSVGGVSINRKGSKAVDGKVLSTEEKYMHSAVASIMSRFAAKLKYMQKFHVIGCLESGDLEIDASDHIFRPGERAVMIRLGEEKTSRRTGLQTRAEHEVAKVVIINSTSSSSIARIEEVMDSDFAGELIIRKR